MNESVVSRKGDLPTEACAPQEEPFGGRRRNPGLRVAVSGRDACLPPARLGLGECVQARQCPGGWRVRGLLSTGHSSRKLEASSIYKRPIPILCFNPESGKQGITYFSGFSDF